jgi:hypothetical protein
MSVTNRDHRKANYESVAIPPQEGEANHSSALNNDPLELALSIEGLKQTMLQGFSQMQDTAHRQTALNQQTQDSITRLEQRLQSQEMAMERLKEQLAGHEAFQKDWNAKITEQLTKVQVDSIKREQEMMDRFNEGFYGSKAKRKEEEDSDGGGWMGWAAAALATAAGVAAYTLKE